MRADRVAAADAARQHPVLEQMPNALLYLAEQGCVAGAAAGTRFEILRAAPLSVLLKCLRKRRVACCA